MLTWKFIEPTGESEWKVRVQGDVPFRVLIAGETVWLFEWVDASATVREVDGVLVASDPMVSRNGALVEADRPEFAVAILATARGAVARAEDPQVILWVAAAARDGEGIPGLSVAGEAIAYGLSDTACGPMSLAAAAETLGVSEAALVSEARRHGVVLAEDGSAVEEG